MRKFEYIYIQSKQLFTNVNMKKETKQSNRHMVAIPDKSYIKIVEYTDANSYIIGKWIGHICEKFIEAEISASYRK